PPGSTLFPYTTLFRSMLLVSTGITGPAAIGANDQDLAPGARVGEYTIEAAIGRGGFGTVYRAVHPVIGKQVAIKVLARKYAADRSEEHTSELQSPCNL